MFLRRTLLFALVFLIIFTSGVTVAEDGYVLSSTGSNHEQDQINKALEEVYNAGGGTVYLSSGVYEITGPIRIGSNTELTGDPDAIIKVSSSSSQWFKDGTGFIDQLNSKLENVTIRGFQIDGNLAELDSSLANSGTGIHNAGRGIDFRGSKDSFLQNIYIYDMEIRNCFSDGLHIAFAENVFVTNCEFSNCQHEGSYFICVRNGLMQNLRIFGITSDCARVDNCEFTKILDCTFYSYTGDENNGATKNGQAGLQIGDQGYSHGGGSDKSDIIHTNNIEVSGCIFADCGRTSIWLDAAGKGLGENIYIHGNQYIDVPEVETDGKTVDVNYINTHSRELSKKVFSSIFDILNTEVTDTGRTEQTAEDIPIQVAEKSSGIIAGGIKIVGFKDQIILDNTTYIPGEEAILIKTKVIKNPDLEQWSGIIKKIDKNESVKIVNGIAYATLKVKTKWYTIKTDPITKKKERSPKKTATATFKDSCVSPDILERNLTVKGSIEIFEDTKNPLAKIKVPYSNTTQKIVYTYDGNSTTHRLMIGERIYNETGLQQTFYSRCDRWEGIIHHTGNVLIIPGEFDRNKLKIEYYTPYESFGVTDLEVIYHETKEENYNMIILKTIFNILLAMFAGYKIMKIAIT